MIFSKRNASFLGAVLVGATSLSAGLILPSSPALAERIANPVAVFSGIDKITGRITTFDVYIDETVQFGALQVTPKVCYSRDEAEAQRVDGFIEVDEITLDRKIRRIFSGWMFADSPGLNAVEHPIYDVWLKDCKTTSDVPPPEGVEAAHAAPVPETEPQQPAVADQAPGADAQAVPADTDPAMNLDTGIDTAQQPEVPPLDAPQTIGDLQQGEAAPVPETPEQQTPVPQINGLKPGTVGLY